MTVRTFSRVPIRAVIVRPPSSSKRWAVYIGSRVWGRIKSTWSDASWHESRAAAVSHAERLKAKTGLPLLILGPDVWRPGPKPLPPHQPDFSPDGGQAA